MLLRRHRPSRGYKTNAETKQGNTQGPEIKTEQEEAEAEEVEEVEEVTEPEQIEGVKRLGSSWYEKDGEKVQGKENAIEKWGNQ